MTFVGKVLVVVQVFLSLCFMAFAGAVFTVQQDWKAAYEKKVTELQAKNTELQERDGQIAYLNRDLAASQAIEEDIQTYLDQLDQFVTGLPGEEQIRTQLRMLAIRAQRAETDKAMLETQVAQLEKQNMETKQSYEKLETANAMVAQEAKERAQEVVILRSANKDLNSQVAVYQDRVFNLEDQLFNVQTDARSAADKQMGLLTKVAFLQDVIRKEGIDVEVAAAKDEPPPLVSGRVLATKSAGRDGAELVEISLGSDDGLSEGHQLEVFSLNGKGKYLGQIKVVYVAADRAVGEVILKSRNGVIQRGDNVTTRL